MKTGAPAFVLALFAFLPVQSLLAVEHCGPRDFSGTYGIVAHGAVTVPGFPITGPFARAGQVMADGQGNLIFHTTASYNGILFSEAISATYTMAPDCTMVFSVEPFAPIFQNATFKAILSDNKRQVDFIIVAPMGQTISAVLKKQDDQACNQKDFSGAYALHLTGSIIVPPVGLVPGLFARVGRIVSDGNGHFSAETDANYNGLVIRPESFSGTYTVAANCAVNIQYTADNVAYVWSGGLVANGKGLDVVVAVPGFAVAGEFSGQ
jgi:hypothetical protein